MNLDALLNPASLAMLVPLLFGVYWIAAAFMKHRERMAMIERGMNPDALPSTARPDRDE